MLEQRLFPLLSLSKPTPPSRTHLGAPAELGAGTGGVVVLCLECLVALALPFEVVSLGRS